MKKYEIVSLGTYCLPRVIFTKAGIKPSKINGELSLPFDLAIHDENYITECIEAKFLNYFDDFKYNLHHKVWIKGNFKIKFNHDDCFGQDDFLLLKERYEKRISNFWKVINSDLPVLFVQAVESDKHDVSKLYSVLEQIRGEKQFELVVIDISNVVNEFDERVNLLKIPYPSQEYIWWEHEWFQKEEGQKFEKAIIDFCKNVIYEKLNCEIVKISNAKLRLF